MLMDYNFYLKMLRITFLTWIRDKEKEKKREMDIRYQAVKYLNEKAADDDQKMICEWLKHNDIRPFPYEFADKYLQLKVDIQYDELNGCYFTMRNGYKMYMKKSMGKSDAVTYIRSILLEQDDESPHRYRYSIEDVDGKIVADIGAAEGFFGLDIIDKVKKIYIFECDQEWINALQLTFAQWPDKVEIVKKYVDIVDKTGSISLNSFFEKIPIDFIKADIEGFEVPMLLGSKKILKKVSKVILCVYHKQNAEKEIKDILEESGFDITLSKGYMFFLEDKDQFQPYLRRGLMYADNNAH